MNYYLKKRLHYHIPRSDMAQMLGIDYNFYYAIEKGDVKMPINLINKFNEILNRGKENEITTTQNELKADEFWQQMKQKNADGRYVLVDKMHEFNIYNYETLVHLLGYSSVGTIYNYLQDKNPVGKEFKKRLYNFFSDELNIQIPKHKKTVQKKKPVVSRPVDKELDAYYKNTDFKAILRERNLTNRELARAIGVHDSIISTMVRKKTKPSDKVLYAVKQFLEDTATSVSVNNTTSDKYISKQKLMDECQKELDGFKELIAEYQKQIDEINAKIELTTKVMDLVERL